MTSRITLVAVLLIAACSTAPPARPAASAPLTEQPIRGGSILIGIVGDQGEIQTLQPILVTHSDTTEILSKLYEPLVLPDAQSGEPRPHLGRWELSADGRTYSWAIDDAAVWSDGTPVTAEDWRTTVRLVGRSTKTQRKSNYVEVEGFQEFADGTAADIAGITVDPSQPKRFTVRLVRSFCPALLTIFGTVPVLPTSVFGKYASGAPRDAIDTAPENEAAAVVTGPFTLREWSRRDGAVLVRNDTYWRGAPFLDEIAYRIMPLQGPQDLHQAEQLKAGRLNFIQDATPRLLEAIAGDARYVTRAGQRLGYTYIGWNTQSQTAPALRDKRVRQALAYGLNADLALSRLPELRSAVRLDSHYPPFHWAHTAGLNAYPYDLARAEELLRSAGYAKGADGLYAKDGQPLSFTVVTNEENPVRKALLQFASDQYRELGVRMIPKPERFGDIVDRAVNGDSTLEAWILGWSPAAEPDPFSVWHSSRIPDPVGKRTGSNLSRFGHPDADAAIEAARFGPACSNAVRKKHYDVLNRILNEEQPQFFGYSTPKVIVVPSELRGFAWGPFNAAPDVHRWWFAPEKN